MEEVRYPRGEYVFRRGEEGDALYVIVSGTASVQLARPGETFSNELAQLAHPDYFGEGALLDNKPRAADVLALSDLNVMRLQRTDFERLLGPLQVWQRA